MSPNIYPKSQSQSPASLVKGCQVDSDVAEFRSGDMSEKTVQP